MKYLVTQLREWTEQEEALREQWDRRGFWVSENSGCARSIYYSWKKEKPTNPPGVTSLQIMRVGKRVEDQLVDDWTKMGIVVPPPEGEEQHRVKIERDGYVITGKLDAKIKETLDDGTEVITPVEVKSYYGDYQEVRLFDLKPNESYAKQLALYMDALNVDRGILYMVNRGSGKQFQFTMIRQPKEYQIELSMYVQTDPEDKEDTKEKFEYKLGLMNFTLDEVYANFDRIHKLIAKDELPAPDFIYKLPLTKEVIIQQTTSDLSAARKGKKVLGDWNCKYCNYKDKCLAEQKVSLGYTEDEVKLINELTAGYTTKNWKEQKDASKVKTI